MSAFGDVRKYAVSVPAPMVSCCLWTLRMIFVELLHFPLSPLSLVVPHAFRQVRLKEQECLRGAFRRKP